MSNQESLVSISALALPLYVIPNKLHPIGLSLLVYKMEMILFHLYAVIN